LSEEVTKAFIIHILKGKKAKKRFSNLITANIV